MNASWAMYFDMSTWKPSEWVISQKVVKDLSDSPFDGNLVHYKDWHDLMRDHLLSTNQGYGRLLYELERVQVPLSMQVLQNNPYAIVGLNADLVWLTRQMWTFISRHVTKSFRKSLRSLVSGEELNGL